VWAIYDAQTDEEVAHAHKRGWVEYIRGWAYDSSGVIIQYAGGSVDEDAANPENPIYKLLVPGATPSLVGTPTSAGESRAPGAARRWGTNRRWWSLHQQRCALRGGLHRAGERSSARRLAAG